MLRLDATGTFAKYIKYNDDIAALGERGESRWRRTRKPNETFYCTESDRKINRPVVGFRRFLKAVKRPVPHYRNTLPAASCGARVMSQKCSVM